MTADLPFSPAADRNKQALLEALTRWLPPTARVLEIASGTGQHAQHFARAGAGWVWQPTEADASLLPAIDARCSGLSNVLPALHLNVMQAVWPVGTDATFDAVYCANLLHISPWPTCAALMQGAAACSAPGGCLLLYGPYRQAGVPTAPSNEAFDADLRCRDPRWGLRALADVEREAAAQGLALHEVVAMPANNLLLMFCAQQGAQ
jgi:SAM-dependent methyltransferase